MSFKKLNAIQYDRKTIEEAKRFILEDELPKDVLSSSKSSQYRFKRKWRGFIVNEGKLFFGALEVVPQEKVNEMLKGMYDDPAIGAGIGRDKFYDKVKQQYLGITKEAVMEFLDNQESYQLNKPYIKSRIVKPIVSIKPNQRWEMDLIVLESLKNKNNGYEYILSVIDTFSKYAWAVALKSKSAEDVAAGIESVILSSGKKPQILQSDNGSEFKNEEMTRVLKRFGVRQVFSLPYAPQSQGQVENWNGYAKRAIRIHFSKTNKKTWIDVLPELVYNWNTSKHGTTEEIPAELADTDDIKLLSEVKDRIEQNAEKVLQSQSHMEPIMTGTWVRVSRRTTTEGRKNADNNMAENWSRELFQVAKVSKDKRFKRGQYKLTTEDGTPVKQVFYRADLQPIDKTDLVKDVGTRKSKVKVELNPENQLLVEDKEGELVSLNVGVKRTKRLQKEGLNKQDIIQGREKRERKPSSKVQEAAEQNAEAAAVAYNLRRRNR